MGRFRISVVFIYLSIVVSCGWGCQARPGSARGRGEQRPAPPGRGCPGSAGRERERERVDGSEWGPGTHSQPVATPALSSGHQPALWPGYRHHMWGWDWGQQRGQESTMWGQEMTETRGWVWALPQVPQAMLQLQTDTVRVLWLTPAPGVTRWHTYYYSPGPVTSGLVTSWPGPDLGRCQCPPRAMTLPSPSPPPWSQRPYRWPTCRQAPSPLTLTTLSTL